MPSPRARFASQLHSPHCHVPTTASYLLLFATRRCPGSTHTPLKPALRTNPRARAGPRYITPVPHPGPLHPGPISALFLIINQIVTQVRGSMLSECFPISGVEAKFSPATEPSALCTSMSSSCEDNCLSWVSKALQSAVNTFLGT